MLPALCCVGAKGVVRERVSQLKGGHTVCVIFNDWEWD